MVASLFLTQLLFARSAEQAYESFLHVQYVKNYDGDSITFNIPQAPAILGRNMRIRVRGIDTPELNKSRCIQEHNKAIEARDLVHKLLQGATTINLHRTGRGKYFRMLADVEFDGRDLGTILLKRELAVSYSGGKRDSNWCDNREISAPSSPRKPAILPPKISGVYVWPPPPVAKKTSNEHE